MKTGLTSRRRLAWSLLSVIVSVAATVALLRTRPSVTLRLDVDAEKPFTFQVFYSEDLETPFSERVTFATDVEAGRSTIRIRIPVKTICQLRLDFGRAPGRVLAGPVRLLGEEEAVLNWNEFAVSCDVDSVFPAADGSLEFVSDKEDPFFVHAGNLHVAGRRPWGLDRGWTRFVLAAVACFSFLCFSVLAWKPLVRGCGWWNPGREFAACRSVFARTFADVRADGAFVLYMLAIAILGWGFELANFTMTFDDEIILFSPGRERWIPQGRWMMFLLDLVLGNVSVPVIPLAATLLLHALSFLLLFGGGGRERYLLFPVYAVFPALFHSFSYSSLNPGVGLGFFLMAAAVRLAFARGVLSAVSGAVLGAAAVGTYQIFLVYGAVAALTCWLQRALRDDRFASFCAIRHFVVRVFVVLAGSAVLYKAVQEAFKTATGFVADTYVDGFVRPISTTEEGLVWLRLMAGKVRQYLFGTEQAFPIRMYAFAALVAVAVAVLFAWLAAGRRRRSVRFAVAAATVLAVALPFAPDVLNRDASIPCRVVTIVLPTALATLLFVAIRLAENVRPLRIACGGLVAASAMQFLWANNQESFGNLLRTRRDAAFAVELKTRIDALPEAVSFASTGRPVPLSVIGCVPEDMRIGQPIGPWPDWSKEMIGISGFSYVFRFDASLRLHTGAEFRYEPLFGLSPELGRFVENMPVWPLNGSVAWFDDRIIVKFTDYLPPDRPFADGPNQRRCRFRNDMKTPVNGFDELVYTHPEEENLLFSYSADDLMPDVSHVRRVDIPACGAEMTFERIGADPWIVFHPFRTDEPYVLLELSAETAAADLFGLWEDVPSQCSRYAFDAGVTTLRLRVPSSFLNRPFRIDLGDRRAGRVVIKSLKIYADRTFTKRFFDLNPGMPSACRKR